MRQLRQHLFSRLPRLLALSAALAMTTVVVSATGPAGSAYAQTPNPVVFVHGWNGSASGWNTMISRFQGDGYASGQLHAWSYNTSQSNVTSANQLSSYVNQVLASTGASQVDIVTHSMGGLNSRYYLKFLGGVNRVDDWVSLAGPNHGTSLANFCFWETSCVEMRPNSTFLNNLNAGDETPGAVSYSTFWSSCDEVISPPTSTILSGAANTQVACMGHSDLRTEASVYTGVLAAVR